MSKEEKKRYLEKRRGMAKYTEEDIERIEEQIEQVKKVHEDCKGDEDP